MQKAANEFKQKLESHNIQLVNSGITQHPFFFPSKEGNEYRFETSDLLNSSHKEFLYQFPLYFRILYHTVDPTKEIVIKYDNVNEDEFTESLLTLFSLKEIIDRSKNYPNFIDVGLTNKGLGHINVYSFDLKSKKFFVRRDGGSNGYDRYAYCQFYCRESYHPSTESLLSFSDLLFDSKKLASINVETYGNEFTPNFKSKWEVGSGISYEKYQQNLGNL